MKLFGDPFLVKASVDDRLSDITARIQAKLQAKPDDFAAWKWSWHSNLAPPEELQVLNPPALVFRPVVSCDSALNCLSCCNISHSLQG